MPSLTIKPPHPSAAPPQLPSLAPTGATTNTQHPYTPDSGATSPVAPAYSPITPKVQPAFPATYPPLPQHGSEILNATTDTNDQPPQQDEAIAPMAEYIPKPPPRPFSSEDSTDAIALRAAISTLQFQKRKAREDIEALEKIKNKALDDPSLFKSELAAGRLSEQRPQIGNLQAILDQADSDSDEEQQATLGATVDEGQKDPEKLPDAPKIPDQTSEKTSQFGQQNFAPFDRIPGPQNVVRMPHINWDKYHISGEALDSMHEQQRKWPGSSFAYGQDRGREHVVAAPYSPFLDSLVGQDGHGRKDSMATTSTVPTPTTSEHPMETRRNVKHQ